MSRLQLACCYTLIAIGLLFALCSAAHRVKADQAYRDVLVLVDWHSLNALPPASADAKLSAAATGAGPSVQSSLDLIKAIPGAQVCYGEETIGTLLAQSIIQPAWLTTGSQAFMVVDGRYADDIAAGADRHGYLSELSAATDGR
jgi:hypothetical protein